MNKSEQIDKLIQALHKCQSQLGGVVADSNNPFFKSKYADLSAVLRAAKPVWHEHGITVIQHPYSDANGIGVKTLVMHISGQWLEDHFTLPLAKLDPQAAGSAITYARRYSLQALALMPTVDDDAEASMLRNVSAKELYKKILKDCPRADNGKPILSDDEYRVICEALDDTIQAAKDGASIGDDLMVQQVISELTDDEFMALWRAPSKGGCWTAEERNFIQAAMKNG